MGPNNLHLHLLGVIKNFGRLSQIELITIACYLITDISIMSILVKNTPEFRVTMVDFLHSNIEVPLYKRLKVSDCPLD